ncbi:MAG: 16S rRNA (cytidine(1402)-2'-O)-methyltransferase [Butyrivibrio sp.]|nr:16S rRNA (cytidine(1402)-2'-O)-methyltransferase [Butyrivibrio sp.]
MAVGKLYLCATPIGNLEDMPVRAVRIMREADLIAAEDTRNSIKLLNHFEIKTPMTSYHEYNKVDKAAVLVDKILAGQTVALITDAGTPGISDPGEELVRQAAAAGIEVIPVPGPAACINALIISGLPTRRFVFEAFLPSDKKERQAVLEELKRETRTMIIYEAPHRLLKTLEELEGLLGGERRIAVCKELTKKHETVYRAVLSEAVLYYTENEPRGEYVLVVEGLDRQELVRQEQEAWREMSVEEHLALYVNQGIERKEAIKLVAKDRGVPKREIYNMTI